jgi:formyltetrahydrofolate-dependent phosphoribosylglycinamide formyltransferase
MFQRLREKWGVSPRQFSILFLVFALTGITAAWLTRYITGWLGMGADSPLYAKILLRLGMLLIGYQILLLLYGALLGQWAFFWRYEKKLLQKLGILRSETMHKPPTVPIAIFASGAGSNAAKIIERLQNHPVATVALIVCNKPGAGVISIAENAGIPVLLIEKERFFRGDAYLPALKELHIQWIVLAGFLWKVPASLVSAFPGHIINIHPALLPKYGGKGMYGQHVHAAVIAAGEKESGITIHYVNEHFDDGPPIFQAKCPVTPDDSPDSLAEKIHQLEHRYFPEIVEKLVTGKKT